MTPLFRFEKFLENDRDQPRKKFFFMQIKIPTLYLI
jgi:hypothetical protein